MGNFCTKHSDSDVESDRPTPRQTLCDLGCQRQRNNRSSAEADAERISHPHSLHGIGQPATAESIIKHHKCSHPCSATLQLAHDADVHDADVQTVLDTCEALGSDLQAIADLQEAIQQLQDNYLYVSHDCWQAMSPGQRQLIDAVCAKHQLLKVIAEDDGDLWATAPGLDRLHNQLQRATQITGDAVVMSGPTDGTGGSPKPAEQQQQGQQQPSSGAGLPSDAGNLQDAAACNDNSNQEAATPLVASDRSGGCSSNCCHYHALTVAPMRGCSVTNANSRSEVLGRPDSSHVTHIGFSKKLQLASQQEVDVTVDIGLVACSKEQNEASTSFCLNVPRITATVKACSEPQNIGSSSSRGNGGGSSRSRGNSGGSSSRGNSSSGGSSNSGCCWGATAAIGAAENLAVYPFVGRIKLTTYGEAKEQPAGTEDDSVCPLFRTQLTERVVEAEGFAQAATSQWNEYSIKGNLKAGVNVLGQLGVDRSQQQAPLPGVELGKADKVLVLKSGSPCPVAGSYPRWCLPITVEVLRYLLPTVLCGQAERLGCLSSNPMVDRSHDLLLTSTIPTSQLPTLALNFGLEVVVGLMQYDKNLSGGFVQNIKKWSVVKEVHVDSTVLRGGMLVEIGAKTGPRHDSCKAHP